MRSYTEGPVHITGNTNPLQNMSPEQGPSLVFQGSSLFDPRFAAWTAGAPGIPGIKDYGLYCAPYISLVDAVPQTASATKLSAAQAVTAATPMTLVSAEAAGLAISIPIIPFSSGSPQGLQAGNKVTPALALDFGFTTGNVTSGSTNVTIPSGAAKFFYKGQPIILSGVGAAANTPLFTTVAATPAPTATTLVISDAPGQSLNPSKIGTADPNKLAAWPFIYAGLDVALADPTQMLGRAVSITGNTGSTAQNFTVSGYDAWGNPQTEVIAFAGGAVTTNGKKAFKYIVSVTPGTSDAGHLLSVGTTDIFGFNLRSDFWEYVNVYWAGAFVTVSTGWTVADGTTPATSSTGDSRGTYAVQSASDGTKRLAIFMSIPAYNNVNANNLNFASLFGVTPA